MAEQISEQKMRDIEFLFQDEVLEQHGEYLVELLQEEIKRKDLIDKGILIKSLDSEKISVQNGRYKWLQIKFPDYGRHIEIERHKRKQQSKFDTNTNRDIWGIRENSMKRKNTNWYSKNAYKSINRLLGTLMYEFTDEQIAKFKGIIERQQMKLTL